MMSIYVYDDDGLEIAIKRQWIIEHERDNIGENKLYFGPVKTHRYEGITYAANRAQFKLPEYESDLDYRMFATNKNGKTIVICELAEIGGLDGFEADCFNIVERTIDFNN